MTVPGPACVLTGGNAFDAAVAVATVLNVVEPMSSSIAGNGFSTVFHKATGAVHSLAMAGAAPLAVEPDELSEAELANAGTVVLLLCPPPPPLPLE